MGWRAVVEAALGAPLLTLDAEGVGRWRQSIVYVWSRGPAVLYVGASTDGLARPLARSHHRLRDLEPGDTLTIWPCAVASVWEIERALIARLRPDLNGATARVVPFRALAHVVDDGPHLPAAVVLRRLAPPAEPRSVPQEDARPRWEDDPRRTAASQAIAAEALRRTPATWFKKPRTP
jgi:hypothetical protein